MDTVEKAGKEEEGEKKLTRGEDRDLKPANQFGQVV